MATNSYKIGQTVRVYGFFLSEMSPCKLTTLNGAIDECAPTLAVTSASGWPSAGIVKIGSEYIAYTSLATNTLTTPADIGRGFWRPVDPGETASRTNAASHATGVSVELVYQFVDPTTIKIKTKNPTGTVTTYTYGVDAVTKTATGIYYTDVSPTVAGVWHKRSEGTGSNKGADEATFTVLRSVFP